MKKSPGKIVILNRSTSETDQGWIHIVPKGELPNPAAGIVQVIDDASLDSILAGIQADQARLGDKWPGIYAGREHFVYDDSQDSAALAWFKTFQKRGDGLWAKDEDLTDIGQESVRNKRYKYTSFVTDRADLKKIDGNRYRIMKIETVGFTNNPNGKDMLTPITNRALPAAPADGCCPDCECQLVDGAPGMQTCPDCKTNFASAGAPAANQKPTTKTNKMKNIATKLGLTAEASEESILAVVTKIMNRNAELEPLADENKTLKNRLTGMDTDQVDGLLAEFKITDAKVINRLRPALLPLTNRAERVAYITDLNLTPAAGAGGGGNGKVLNRGAGDAKRPEVDPTEEAAKQADKVRANKISNRANQLVKEVPHLSLATAYQMAATEIPE